MAIVIKSIDEFRQKIKSCREVKIVRSMKDTITYTHHMLVTRANKFKCEILQYGGTNFVDYLCCKFPAMVYKLELIYDEYNKSDNTEKIVDFDKGEELIIVDRKDYPKTQIEEENVIKRAESRLGEQLYSAHSNNCESYVNWVFTDENESKQIKNAGVGMSALADITDTNLSDGVLRNYGILGSQLCAVAMKKSEEDSNRECYTENKATDMINETKQTNSNVSENLGYNDESKIGKREDKKVSFKDIPESKTNQSMDDTKQSNTSVTNTVGNGSSEMINKAITPEIPTEPFSQTGAQHAAFDLMEDLRNSATKIVAGIVTAKQVNKVARDASESLLRQTQYYKNASQCLAAAAAKPASNFVAKEITSDVGLHIVNKTYTKMFENASQNLAAESAKATSKTVAKEITSELSKNIVKGTTTKIAENASQHLATESAKATSKHVAKEITSDVSKTIVKGATKKIAENASQNLAAESARATSKTVANTITSDAGKHIVKGSTEIKGNVANAISKQASVKTAIAKPTKIQTIKQNVTKSTVFVACAFEAAVLTKKIYNISNNEQMNDKEKERHIVREVGTSMVSAPISVIGSAIGQTLIPVPFVGGLIGAVVGSHLGGTFGAVVSGAVYDRVTG